MLKVNNILHYFLSIIVLLVANWDLVAQINVFRKGNMGKLRYSSQKKKDYRTWMRKF